MRGTFIMLESLQISFFSKRGNFFVLNLLVFHLRDCIGSHPTLVSELRRKSALSLVDEVSDDWKELKTKEKTQSEYVGDLAQSHHDERLTLQHGIADVLNVNGRSHLQSRRISNFVDQSGESILAEHPRYRNEPFSGTSKNQDEELEDRLAYERFSRKIDRKKRDVNASDEFYYDTSQAFQKTMNDSFYDDLPFTIEHSRNSEEMEAWLETSTLGASEERLFHHYATKNWSLSNLNYSSTASSHSKKTAPTSEFMSIEEERWNKTFPLSASEEARQREFKSIVWEGGYSTAKSKKRARPQLKTLNYWTNTTAFEGTVTFTYTVPTKPPFLSDSQESWYAGFDERLKTTLSMDQFRPNDPTWWKSWPSTNWDNFTWTTFPPNYSPTTKDILPIYRFPSYEAWQNYTHHKLREANLTADKSSDHSVILDYSDERFMNGSVSDRRAERFGTRRPAAWREPFHETPHFPLPQVHLTPPGDSYERKAKNRRFWRGRGKQPKYNYKPRVNYNSKEENRGGNQGGGEEEEYSLETSKKRRMHTTHRTG